MATKKKKDEALPEGVKEKTPKKKTVRRTKHFKKDARKRVAEDWPEIVDELVTKAKKGSYNHTKLLVEVSGIKEEELQPARKGRNTMTTLLMKRLTEKEAERS